MRLNKSPFTASESVPGYGKIHLAVLPPSTPVLQTLSYQYPLKLIAPAVTVIRSSTVEGASHLVFTVFFLTYGGGLVGGDSVNLNVSLVPTTRLIVLTQGSTKIFKSPDASVLTTQATTVDIGHDASLCYLPDPVQPFENSAFEQTQIYTLADASSNLCACDWVCEGRSARGERWSFYSYASRNEVWTPRESGKPKLLLRDNLFLRSKGAGDVSVVDRMDGLGVFGTLIVHGPLFNSLGIYFLEEFKAMPRIGNRQWDKPSPTEELDPKILRRTARLQKEQADGLLWSCAATRGFVVVKFGAREVQGARHWLRHMLHEEGTVEREFGERALLCLR